MKFTSFLPVFLLPLSALASPVLEASPLIPRGDNDNDNGHGKCVNKKNVQEIVNTYAQLVGNFDVATANKYLATNFQDYSDSINQLIGKPSGSATFDKVSFIAAQTKNPKIPLTVDSIAAKDCDTVDVIWHTVFGAGNTVRGISSLHIVCDGDNWQFSRWDVEFNNIAWMLNLGGGYTLNGQKFGNVQC